MTNILNNVFTANIKFCKNIKYKRVFSGKCENKYINKTNKITPQNVITGIKFDIYNDRAIFGDFPKKHTRNFSSFMKNVIEQVKKDMKENKQYQEALKELKEKTEIDDKAIKLKKKIEENINILKNIKGKNEQAIKIIYNDIKKLVTHCFENYYIFKLSKNLSVQFFSGLTKILLITTDKINELTDKWNDNNAFMKLDKWRQEMAIKRYKKKTGINEKDSDNKNGDGKDANLNDSNSGTGNELILAHESAWDKFGSKLKDMPFLNNFFENPILGKLFGETELAAALRIMKMDDKNFKLSELMYLFEFVISKHIVESYLIGDEDTLRLHCGEAAFNSLNSSINERKKKKLFLDTNVLIYKNHELKGAQRMEESSPWFIFTFHTQQINCLKNKDDEIVEGKIDDIREVVYTIALSKHPEPETEGLLYPYIIREFAIIGNTPSW
ncbi:mitochondrial import inner membrane translocase subunit TIM44, putative [Plasmodium berghei]|uniref:Mitochondrial import inner membrane translocase subunit TIM44, putative n=2 Tax=Plasmodium berghei TaxID=5821 RepID=A0A509AJW3_PLABA|nr:mitochondrial import inner membrane translocase subunit TIM44, putative [Plasmodium berghei ANKA]CXI43131.1 mitochondrial import inner membrane translocase subunit TIM44, putative [Plasmodium berghei]SCM22253.1 mitochondrial import inner membrane translocase subunit TIM44, putative [Plasmodium berghei]SCN25359.1 mitochondrial import inner membrane translocase subunit TIM44, putative [Plasmodium berghei]SCO60328.1 mitochondrial import inner membrane translocase subunit TIM44, putative [Plasmo|eukprot:XP_034421579.1 mitochondrial import inner membrane translocase subunit TIM44, putative [Plasmodium berghei ANKA]